MRSRLGTPGLAGAALAAVAAQPHGRIYGAANIERYLRQYGRSRRQGQFDPVFNRHTGKPHESRRAIARATTAPGTPERAAAMAAARVPSK